MFLVKFLRHHQELKFSLTPGASRLVSLPKKDCPVRIEVSISNIVEVIKDKAIVTGPFLMQALVTYDSASRKLVIVDGPSVVEGDGRARASIVFDSETGKFALGTSNTQDVMSDRINYCVKMRF